MFFEVDLVKSGQISAMQLVTAIDRALHLRTPLGRLALVNNKITMRQLFEVLDRQADVQRPFGEIAVSMGFMTEEDLACLLLEQANAVPSISEILVDMEAIDRNTLKQAQAAYYANISTCRESNVAQFAFH